MNDKKMSIDIYGPEMSKIFDELEQPSVNVLFVDALKLCKEKGVVFDHKKECG